MLVSVFSLSVQAQNGVVINEIMASNTVTVADNAGDFDDWIELFNTSGVDVDLSGWYITDKPDNLTKYDIPTGTMILANEYLIIWADEDSSQGPNPVHANFKLSAAGETVILLDASISVVDSISFGQQTTDMAYARRPNGTGNFVIQAPTYKGNNDLVSTKNVMRLEEFKMFPNPTSGMLNILIESNDYEHEIFEVFDATGKKVKEFLITNTTFQIDLSTFGEGLYVMKYGETVKRVLVLK
jgi:hypothetical protein